MADEPEVTTEESPPETAEVTTEMIGESPEAAPAGEVAAE